MVVLVTNDDGYQSPGIYILYKAAKKVFGDDVVAVAPHQVQSSSGMSFTFHKPLRVEKINHKSMPVFSVSGTPSDCVFMGVYHLFRKKVNLVLSGINIGMNAGLETVYSSGTISASIFGAISGIPSVAFSKNIVEDEDESGIERDMNSVYNSVVSILSKIKKSGFPKQVELLNINFPYKVDSKTKIRVVKTDHMVFDDLVVKKSDPRGKDYYWLYGNMRKDLDPSADIYNLFKGYITITPIKLSAIEEESLLSVKKLFDTK
ncbi:MAG: 5'/3'-nucleotidase SurE [Candidatus Parvarchaeota archaeon]|jgi:5'-nucleotidase|nr:5'/3'-nucleotidase SurE [Candidatus Parvarchaeota archaeon]